MPKERHHLLLAEETLRIVQGRGEWPRLDEESESAYLIGSISPDVLFYDLPALSLTSLGNDLHRFQGEAGASFFRTWIEEERERLPEVFRAWMAGVVNHFLADSLWHPCIDGLCRSAFRSRAGIPADLSAKNCHHWLESELEALWLLRLRGPGAYLPLLTRVSGDRKLRERYSRMLKGFLERAGFTPAPSIAVIQRCFFWQAFCLRCFSDPLCSGWKARLLGWRPGHYLGSLIIPARPSLPEAILCRPNATGGEVADSPDSRNLEDPMNAEFMARSLLFLANGSPALRPPA